MRSHTHGANARRRCVVACLVLYFSLLFSAYASRLCGLLGGLGVSAVLATGAIDAKLVAALHARGIAALQAVSLRNINAAHRALGCALVPSAGLLDLQPKSLGQAPSPRCLLTAC
jgi:hypothetical protein